MDTQQNQVPVLSRLRAVEGSNRRLKWAIGILALLFVFARLPILPTRAIEARQFSVKDDAGRVRAQLGMMEKGRVGFALADSNGKARVLIHLDERQCPMITLADAREVPRLSALLDGDDAILTLLDAQSNPHVAMLVQPSGSAKLRVLDQQGDVTWSAE